MGVKIEVMLSYVILSILKEQYVIVYVLFLAQHKLHPTVKKKKNNASCTPEMQLQEIANPFQQICL